jgi:hypothetical protein
VFRTAARLGLFEAISPELQRAADGAELSASLDRLDAYRAPFTGVPETFTNPVLLGSLLVPLGFSADSGSPGRDENGAWLGTLPVARRDVERLSQVLAMQRRLRDPNISVRSARSLMARGAFADSLAWLEIHGEAPEAVARWGALVAELTENGTLPEAPSLPAARRRRRRRGPHRPAGI